MTEQHLIDLSTALHAKLDVVYLLSTGVDLILGACLVAYAVISVKDQQRIARLEGRLSELDKAINGVRFIPLGGVGHGTYRQDSRRPPQPDQET